MEEHKVKIIVLSDLLDTRARKEKELRYYEEQLEILNEKMYWIRREIDLTNNIINMIEHEKLLDLREHLKQKDE
jgi:hypothetical protein